MQSTSYYFPVLTQIKPLFLQDVSYKLLVCRPHFIEQITQFTLNKFITTKLIIMVKKVPVV